MKQKTLIIKNLIAFFIVALIFSGLTAIPVATEIPVLLKMLSPGSSVYKWLEKVLLAYRDVNDHYAFLLYGYDWLAFAHFMLAILFIGPYRDPLKNIWIIEFGMIACVLVIPLAMIAGYFRHIPPGWQLTDCAFGVFGYIPLKIIHRKTVNLIKAQIQ